MGVATVPITTAAPAPRHSAVALALSVIGRLLVPRNPRLPSPSPHVALRAEEVTVSAEMPPGVTAEIRRSDWYPAKPRPKIYPATRTEMGISSSPVGFKMTNGSQNLPKKLKVGRLQ
ncbi:hypothetical protein PoB_004842400 [Plakobranchus ocellatus]|uniref:Uncharacterized protein n=1 Tax=Plakobranchus ocellatus TaxID=259542 RepID=A0AAV4BP90_9GAST|nr:hypothetical protein PoB_004842400 [Plakobranchus ocellatus]